MIDLRSDILVPMSPGILRAWKDAAARPPAFGLAEDPDERALIDEVSEYFGLEAGVLVPTGTMANQIALMLHCSPGERILADADTHIVINEAQSTAGVAGVEAVTVAGDRGHPSPEQVAPLLGPSAPNRAARRLSLVCLENTHNRAGGTIMPCGQVQAIADLARAAGASLHIDGARLWNAMVALETDGPGLVAGADTLAVNLNKGLGAPLGSLLLGSIDAMTEAAAIRRMLGGWWRPLGPVAAAARAALKDYRPRLAADHTNARTFAEIVADVDPEAVDLPQTNIVMVRFSAPSQALVRLENHGVRASDYGTGRLRFVFHGGQTPSQAEQAAHTVLSVMKELQP